MGDSNLAGTSALDPELADLERRTWRYLGDDGLGDLMLGLAFACFGAGMVWNLGTFAVVAPALFVMNWKPLHQRFIVPRRGIARLRPERQRFLKSAMARTVALQVLLVLTGVVIWIIMDQEAAGQRWKNIMPVIVMLPFPLILALLGKWFDVPRFFAHAAVMLLTILGLHLAGLAEGWPLLISGALLIGHGALQLLRFFRAHPRPDRT